MKTTVVGNYPKVAEGLSKGSLRNAIHQFDTGKLSAEGLEEIKDCKYTGAEEAPKQ